MFLGQWWIQGRGPGARVPPLFLDQTEARRAETNFSETAWPPPAPPPPSYLKVWSRHCLDDGNGSFPDFVHAGNHITNQSEIADECSENVNITTVLFLSPNNKDDTKEDFLFCPNQLPGSEYLLGKNDTGIYVKERENLGLAINDLHVPVSQQDNKYLIKAGKNSRIKWMAKYVCYLQVCFLPGWFESKWPGKRLSVIINSQCKKNAFDVFYR